MDINGLSKYLIFIFWMFSVQVYAIPCSTTGKILYKGDTLDQVIAECGTPSDKRSYVNTLITAERLIYYKNISGQPFKLSVTLNNNQVVNIELDKQNLSSTNVCGNIINVGDFLQNILSSCGNPNYRKTLDSIDVEITEIKYATTPPETGIFENGKLVDWK